MARTIYPDIIGEQDIAHLPGDCSIREAGRYMVDHDVGSVLIMNGEELQGIFTERDALEIFVATRRNPDQTNIADVMTKSPQTIAPGAAPNDALQHMLNGGFRHLPVVDDNNKVLGMVSLRDLIGEAC